MDEEKVYVMEYNDNKHVKVQEGIAVATRYGATLVRIEQDVPIYKWFDSSNVFMNKEKAELEAEIWNTNKNGKKIDKLSAILMVILIVFMLVIIGISDGLVKL